MRGIHMVGAIAFLAELGDLSRFENPRQLMAYLGLTPSERSTGESVKRGGITKAGNTRARTAAHRGCVELPIPATRQQGYADQDRGRATDGPRDCLEGADAALWPLPDTDARKGKRPTIVVTAIARELSAFIWAINREVEHLSAMANQ